MSEDYLHEEHFEEDESKNNIENCMTSYDIGNDGEQEEKLQLALLEQITLIERADDKISKFVENKLATLLSQFGKQTPEEILKMRMNELALNKILVYTHGKSQFRLVIAHHHLGKSYLNYKCYEQSIDHLTLAFEENVRLNDLKGAKLYHSCMLNTISKCYYETANYQGGLQVLLRAQDFQNICKNQEEYTNTFSIQTCELLANTYCKLKNSEKSIEYCDKAIKHSTNKYGEKSIETIRLKVVKAKILEEQKDLQGAIAVLEEAISQYLQLKNGNKLQTSQLYEQIAGYYFANGQYAKQIDSLQAKLKLYNQIYDQSHKESLRLKKTIIMLMIKHKQSAAAIGELESILQIEQGTYGQNSLQVAKTLKMMGDIYMSDEKMYAEAKHYLKRTQNILEDYGNQRAIKDIRTKLSMIRVKGETKAKLV